VIPSIEWNKEKQMKFLQNDVQLTLYITDEEKAELRRMENEDPQHFGSDEAMWDFFEPMMNNSSLSWVNASDTGDLTDAPMLGIIDYENTCKEKKGPYGAIDLGMGEYAPIVKRWAFVEYESTSVLNMLLTIGKCMFVR
jgi:hypothetical protein